MSLHGKEIKIFCGNANKKLTSDIAEHLGISVSNADVLSFSDGEISVSIGETVRGADAFVIQSTCHPVNTNLMELLIMIDALKRASASRITAVIPYFGYARQDRKTKSRDPISAKLVADLIATAGANRILTMDLHAPQIQGFFNIPVDHLLGVPLLAHHFEQTFKCEKDDFVLASPDLGSVTRVRAFAAKINAPIAIIDKRRQRANQSEVMNIIGDVKDKKVLLIDDMIDTAGTLCNAAEAIIKRGGAKEVYACATHGVLSGDAIKRIEESKIKEVVLLNTIPLPTNKQIKKIKVLHTSPIFAEAIARIYEEQPISPLFD